MTNEHGKRIDAANRAAYAEWARRDDENHPPTQMTTELIDPRRYDARVQTAAIEIQRRTGCSLVTSEGIAISVIEALWASGDLNGNRPGAGSWLEDTWDKEPWD